MLVKSSASFCLKVLDAVYRHLVRSVVFRFGYSVSLQGISGHVPPFPYFLDDRIGQRLAAARIRDAKNELNHLKHGLDRRH
jgi:hypothetical protein